MTTDIFTSNGTFVVPERVYEIIVESWGAGGGGAVVQIATQAQLATGGGGGAYSRSTIPVTPGEELSVVVGQGGPGKSLPTSKNGDDGGDSKVSRGVTDLVLAKGGKGGIFVTGAAPISGNGGVGGLASEGIGDVKFSGGRGGNIEITSGTDDSHSGGGAGAGDANGGGNAPDLVDNFGNVSGGIGGEVGGGDGGSTSSGNGSLRGGAGAGLKTASTETPSGSGARGEVRISYSLAPAVDTVISDTPSMKTNDVTEVELSTAEGSGEVLDNFEKDIVKRGFVTIQESALPYTGVLNYLDYKKIFGEITDTGDETVTKRGFVFGDNKFPSAVGQIAHFKLNEDSNNTNVEDALKLQLTATASKNTEDMSIVGKVRKAISFVAGDNDFVNIPHDTSQLLTGGITISAWIKPPASGPSDPSSILDKSSGVSAADGFNFGYRIGSKRVEFRVNGGTLVSSGDNTVIGDGLTWFHVVVTVTPGGLVTFYVDGEKVGTPAISNPLSGITTTNDMRIGSRSGGGSYYNGAVDDIRIFNKVITKSEIDLIYNSGDGTEGRDENPGNVALSETGYDDFFEETGTFEVGIFSTTIENLEENTEYFYRSFAESSAGIVYGDEKAFKIPLLGVVTSETGTFGKGEYSLEIVGLEHSNRYYTVAFAESSEGAGFGGEKLFKTRTFLLEVETASVENTERTGAEAQGSVLFTSAVITRRGFVYDTVSRANPGNIDPDVSDYQFIEDESGTFGTGNFNLNLSGLTPGQDYFVRAFAQNEGGFSYGEEIEFTALLTPPEVATLKPKTYTEDSFMVKGKIISTFENANKRGFVFGETAKGLPGNVAPDSTGYDDFIEEEGSFEPSIFTLNIEDIDQTVDYYMRAYAQNSDGYAYGNEIKFKIGDWIPRSKGDDITWTPIAK